MFGHPLPALSFARLSLTWRPLAAVCRSRHLELDRHDVLNVGCVYCVLPGPSADIFRNEQRRACERRRRPPYTYPFCAGSSDTCDTWTRARA